MRRTNILKINYASLFRGNIHAVLICGFLIFIPFSNTAKAIPNIILALLVIIWFFRATFKEDWHQLNQNPIFYLVLALTFLYPLSLFWTDNLVWGWDVASSQARWLAIPFIMLLAEKRHIKYYISAFILGMTLAEILSYFMYFGILFQNIDRSFATPFYVHIAYNPMLALAVGFLLIAFFQNVPSVAARIVILCFITTMVINMFLTGGRNGQVTMFAIMMVVLLLYFTKKFGLIKALAATLLSLAVVFSLAYSQISLFKERVDLAVNEVQTYSPDHHTSVGLRLNFYINTWSMFIERPWSEKIIGSGVGDFPEDYNQSLKHESELRMGPSHYQINHPHNQFLYHLSTFGLIGLALLMLLYAFMYRHHNECNDEYKTYRLVFIVWMFVIQLPDTLFLLKPVSFVMIMFIGIFFAQYYQTDDSDLTPIKRTPI